MITPKKNELNAMAQRMLRDYDAGSPGTIFGEGLRLKIADAWRLQTAIAKLREQRGEHVIGYKIGCICEKNQKLMGLSNPVWGRLWSTEQHPDRVILNKRSYANVALEAEFAIILKRNIEPTKISKKNLTDSISSIYPVIEIHNLVLRGSAPHGAELLANNCIHAGFVRGSPSTNVSVKKTTNLALHFDKNIVDSWSSLIWPNDILSSIHWLAQRLSCIGESLRKGTIILTGAFGPPIPLGGNSRVRVTSSGFGEVSAEFK